jgi:hypothetical protein
MLPTFIDHKSGQSGRRSVFLLILILLALTMPVSQQTTNAQQDLTFRLINLEREVETLRTRVDILERMVRNTMPGDPLATSSSNQSMVEIQRQMLSLAEQQIIMQTQLLELRKAVDEWREKNSPAGKKSPGN